MGSRRIAGGIFVFVATATPVLVQAMDLKIPQPIGFAGLAICFALLVLGIFLALAPSREPPDLRREREAALGGFLSRGTELMALTQDRSAPLLTEDANAWLADLTEYLEREFGPAYVARVNDGASAPTGYGEGSPYSNLRNGIRVRIFHLQEFLKELARA